MDINQAPDANAINAYAWVKISAANNRAAESMLYETLGCVPDGAACGCGFPLVEASSLSPALVDAAKASSHARAIVQSVERKLVLISASKASVHAALLLLLRDGLARESSLHREVIAFTCYDTTLAAIQAAVKAKVPQADAHRASLMLPLSDNKEGGMERVFLSTDKGYLESVGKIIGDACNGLQSMYGVRLALPGAPPPPMVALLPLGGGSSNADNELLSQIAAGAEPKVLAPAAVRRCATGWYSRSGFVRRASSARARRCATRGDAIRGMLSSGLTV